MALAKQRLTLDEFLKLSEQEPVLEYLEGVVSQKMSPTGPHSTLQPELVLVFDRTMRPGRLGRVFTEPRITFGAASLVPDFVVYRWSRIPSDPNGDIPTYFTTPPDITVEIASPGQTIKELSDRCRWMAQHGVGVTLLVVPRDRSVRVFREGSVTGPLRAPERIDLGDIIEGLELSIEELFASLRARWD